MSGTGQKGSSAPAYLTPMAPGQPIGETADGKAILPSFYFSQMIVRILAYLGQPVGSSSSGGGGTLTIGEQIAALQESITLLESANLSSAALAGRLAALEDVVSGVRISVRRPADTDSAETAKTIATWGM